MVVFFDSRKQKPDKNIANGGCGHLEPECWTVTQDDVEAGDPQPRVLIADVAGLAWIAARSFLGHTGAIAPGTERGCS